MSATPWMKFYPSDWRSCPELRICSLAARGLWADMLCVMHEATPRGSLLIAGRKVDGKQLAALCGAPLNETVKLLGELAAAGVFSREEDGTIYSRRMRADEIKSLEGRKQIAKRWGDRPPTQEPNRSPNRSPTANPITQKPDTRSQIEDDGGDAREAMISQGAIRLADSLAEICGHGTDPKAHPLAWHGAPMRVQTWLNEGWPVEIITATVREVVGRKSDGAPESVSYFEKPIAKAIARQAKPLPKVQTIPGETVDVVQASGSKSASAAGVRILERLRNLNIPPARERLSEHARLGKPAAESGSGVRDGTGDFAPRLLSQG